MSLRRAKNKLTGTPVRSIEIVLGHTPLGHPQATLKPRGLKRYSDVPLASPSVVQQLIDDLTVAAEHLEGK